MSDAPQEGTGKKTLTRRKLFTGAAAAVVLAAAGTPIYRHVSSTSSIHVESFLKPGSGQKKYVLVLTGSAREGGNSDLLAEAFVRGAVAAGHTAETFSCGRLPMNGCLHCEGCWTSGRPCVQTDNFEKLWPSLEKADMLVLCTPLYWYSMTGQIKCALDRLYPYFKKNRLRDLKVREAMLLMCGQTPFPRSFAGAAESYRQILGYTGWSDRGRLFVTGVDRMGAMKGDSALRTAEDMGRQV